MAVFGDLRTSKMVLACRAEHDFQEISVFVLGGEFCKFVEDFGSILGSQINQKSIKNQKNAKKKPIALGRRLDSVLRAILAVKVEKRRLPGSARRNATAGGEDPRRGTRSDPGKDLGKSSGQET